MMAASNLDTNADAHLIRRAQSGDSDAFARLVRQHYDFIFRVAYRWCGRKADAEDVAQEVCIRIGRSISAYRGGGAFNTWLYAMTLNAARDLRRRSAREEAKGEAFRAHALSSAVTAPETQGEDPAEVLWAAVRRLPYKQRDAVLLVYGEGLSHASAADVMGNSEATVSWHVHEAKKRLKQMMLSAGEV
jgi:RNA polymerase sigma-70 factor (ECF subfamily)